MPPSGLWKSHAKPRYLDASQWLSDREPANPEQALAMVVERYLRAHGPVAVGDIVKWAGQRRITAVRSALTALGDRVVRMPGPDGVDLVDLADLDLPDEDTPAPARYLSRWDSVLIAYADRERILPGEYKGAVIKKNGDFLPTFLVDGFVAGLWSVDATGDGAVLRLEPFGQVAGAARAELEEEGEALVRYVEPAATSHGIEWISP